MNFNVETNVQMPYQEVYSHFDRHLLTELSPWYPRMKLVRFDGCSKNDQVHLKLDFLLFSQDWNSQIIETGEEHRGLYFIDQGIKLPFFLYYWEHKHLIRRCGSGATIIDAVYFKSRNIFFDWLLLPFLWMSFQSRSKIYQKFFGHMN